MKRAAVLIAILLSVVATGCASAPTRATDAALIQPASPAKTVVVNCQFKTQTRPSWFILTCADANDALAHLHRVTRVYTANRPPLYFCNGTRITCYPQTSTFGLWS